MAVKKAPHHVHNASKAVPAAASGNSPLPWILAAGLFLLTITVFWPVTGFDFVLLDDNTEIYENPNVISGLSAGTAVWAVTAVENGFWFPLTRLSHLAAVSLFGLEPAGHHAINLVLHALTAGLLFLALYRLTGAMWPGACAAAIYAVHPLRVESVAWVTERKDVLSGLFLVLSLWAYGAYATRPSARRLTVVTLLYLCGLMSKPSVVTLPVLLLILDYWPLDRWKRGQIAGLLREKAALAACAIGAAAVTYSAHATAGGLEGVYGLGLTDRLMNAPVSYALYLRDTVWPFQLAAFYPYKLPVEVWKTAAALCLLVAITFAAWRARRAGYALAGWAWFLVAIVPNIGIVQAGAQSRADRFTYIAHIGLWIAVVWSVCAVAARAKWLPYAAILLLSIFGVRSRMQAGYWRDSATLFEHTLRVAGGSAVIANNYGMILSRQGRAEEALQQFDAAVAFDPYHFVAHANRGATLLQLGRPAEALAALDRSLSLDPDQSPRARLGRASALANLQRYDEALALCNALLATSLPARIRADTLNTRGGTLLFQGKAAEAQRDFESALRIDPALANAQANLGNSLVLQNRLADALRVFDAYLISNPGDARIRETAEAVRRQLSERGGS